MGKAEIIIIDGASSSGRTSLVRRFCGLAGGEYVGLHLDEFTHSLPQEKWEAWCGSDQGWAEIAMAFNRHIAAAAQGHRNLIADTFYKLPAARNHLFDLLGRENLFYVQIFCDLAELERREAQRGDRSRGLARSQFDQVYSFTEYDLMIDSTEIDMDTCALLLLEQLPAASLPNAADHGEP